jgi:DNA-binding transcriptional regulator YdaS (Cro superfamily)
MNLKDYFASANSLSVTQLATALGLNGTAQLRQWTHGYSGRRPDAKYCVLIERETCGAVTRRDLRPEDWSLIWPELAETHNANEQ